jgi:uncharacterized protein YkwD
MAATANLSRFRLVCLAALATLTAADAAAGQTSYEVAMLASVGRRLAAAERALQDPVKLASAQGDVASLITHFRKAGDATQRQKVVTAVIEVGGAAPQRLLAFIESDFRQQLRRYKGEFQNEVAAVARQKRGGVSAAQLVKLQTAITDLVKDPGLTSGKIAAEADPALKKLEDIFSIDRRGLLGASTAAAATRQSVIDLLVSGRRLEDRIAIHSGRTRTRLPSPGEVEAEMQEAEELAAMLATPMTHEAQSIMFDNLALERELDALEAQQIRRLNVIRIWCGLTPLAIDLKLVDASRGHCKDMKSLNFFAHESPVSGKRTPWDRARLAGTSASGENIAAGYNSAEAVTMGWWHSPGHFKNMMNGGFRRIGVGRVDQHWTQMFGS